MPLPHFKCPDCKAKSYNPTDIELQYCARCHTFPEQRHRRCAKCDDPITQEGGWASSGEDLYCFKEECQKAFYAKVHAVLRAAGNNQMADKLEAMVEHVDRS